MKNRKLVVGNWKMNPRSIQAAKELALGVRRKAKDLRHTEVVVCPPFIFLGACQSKSKAANFNVGSQSVSADQDGAFTGQVSAGMVASLGLKYSIVGHSEERERGDTDERVNQKILRALEASLIPVVCVGERDRDNESGSHFEYIKEQMKNTFKDVPKKHASSIILAYEPVWAVGGMEPMSSDQIYEMCIFVKKVFSDIFGTGPAMKVKVLYGGSVNANNAYQIMSIGQVDGLLVGRESLNLSAFSELIKVVDSVKN